MISRKKKVRLFQRKEALPKAKAQQVLSIYGGIPCNLAPAHFTVHIVQVRLNFALGFAVGANPAWNLSFFAASICDCISYTLWRLARFRAGEGKSDPPSAKANKINSQTALGDFNAQMKHRDPRAYGVPCFPFSDALPFLLDRQRKRFLAFARNDGTRKRYSCIASFSHGKGFGAGMRLSLLPMEGGAPKERRLALATE